MSKKNGRKNPKKNGFTLVEVMVVIVIIGLLATVVVINVLPAQDKANVTKAQADIATLSQAVEMYRLENNVYPDAGAGLQALTGAGGTRSYVRSLPDDPWGNPYQYRVPGRQGGGYDIFSLGADGAEGGSDLAADIYGQ